MFFRSLVLCFLLSGAARIEGAPSPWLSLVTSAWGIAHAHRSGPSLLFNPEVIGPGVALFDLDGDGLPDIFFPNGAEAGPGGTIAARYPDRIYRNEGGRFTEVTAGTAILGAGFGCGVLAVDIDNDGYPDLVLTGYKESLLYHNNGDGTFTEEGRLRGLPPLLFAATTAAADVDRNGFLDLYVGNYLDFDYKFATKPIAVLRGGRVLVPSLGSTIYAGVENLLLGARGDGSFEDGTRIARVGNNEQGASRTMGVLFADLDRDGWPDLVVANDQSPMAMYHNRGQGRFDDYTTRSWLSDSRGNMGIAAGDFDGNGWPDLYITHFDREHNALYRSLGASGRYQDVSFPIGLAGSDWDLVGWGAAWVDLDADGRLDLLVANGHLFPLVLEDNKPLPARIQPMPLRQTLYRNRGGRDFESLGAGGFAPAVPVTEGRGVAVGDLDHDGSPDVVIAVNNGPPLVLRNVATPRGAEATLELVGTESNRDAVGARIEVVTRDVGGRPLFVTREVHAGNGYLSTDAAEVHLGLGAVTGEVTARIFWPSGRWQDVQVPVGKRLRVVE